MKDIRQFLKDRQEQFGKEADMQLEGYHRRLGALDLINIINDYLDSPEPVTEKEETPEA